MGSKTRLSSYCTKRANNGVNLVTSRKIITRLARPIASRMTAALGSIQTGRVSANIIIGVIDLVKNGHCFFGANLGSAH